MKNLGNMLKQAQEMQTRMQELQDHLSQTEVTGSSGAGMIQITLSGKGEARAVKIDKSLLDPNEGEVLEDLLLAAFNDARGKVDAKAAEEMSKLTGGLQLPPGFKLPF